MPFPRFPFLTLALLALPVAAAPSKSKTSPASKSLKTPVASKSAVVNTVSGLQALSTKDLPKVALAGWKYGFAEDELEVRWSWRGRLAAKGNGEARVVFGWHDARNFALLHLTRTPQGFFAELLQVENNAQFASALVPLNGIQGELTVQTVGARARVLWNGTLVAQMNLRPALARAGNKFGTAARGAVALQGDDVQPTAPVVFRDDFMRAEAPDDAEVPDEWHTVGLWKTSGTLGPKSDAALNPNPFVFRATADGSRTDESRARAGNWFWSDYAVSASVRATLNDDRQPLVAALEAFGQSGNAGVRGEIDFRTGIARIKQGNRVLAQSEPFDAEVGGWHRVRLEPGPGGARLLVDGIERVRAQSLRAQGDVTLAARVAGANFVDFDDVRVEPINAQTTYGETLPERFKVDRLIRYWANDALAWKRDGNGTWWHTGDFYGAANVEIPLPKFASLGDGLQIRLGAQHALEGKAEPLADVVAELKRIDAGHVRVSLAPKGLSAVASVVALKSDSTSPLVLSFVPTTAGRGTTELRLRGQKVLQAPTRRTPNSTKIGVCPLKAGKPLPAPALRSLYIVSGTYEREGRAVVGVNITPVTRANARELGLPDATGTLIDYIDPDSPASKAGVQIGDVVRGVGGVRVADVDSMRAAVGAVQPGAPVTLTLLRPQGDASGVDWSKCRATTPQVVDYAFTSAPVDWRAARGKWEVSERWTCSPQWSFFAGSDDVAPLLWSRFATQGDWTLEAYLATPMDLSRGERSPSDLNISVEGDGRNIASGYSFLFSAKNRMVNRIYRGDTVAWEKGFEIPPGVGDTHQDWFYVRIERRSTPQGLRFQWSVNGREIANYLDTKPRTNGGAVAFWTKNGGMSIARLRLWHSGIAPQKLPAPSLGQNRTVPVNLGLGSEATNELGIWSVRGEGPNASARLSLLPYTLPETNGTEAKTQPLRLENPQSGGDWTVYVTRDEFDPKTRPVLEWDYAMPADVKMNLYVKVNGAWREILFSGPSSESKNGNEPLGSVPNVVPDGGWHHARFDLLTALRRFGLADSTVQAVAFAAPDVEYLRAGLGGNHLGASWQLHHFTAHNR